MPVAVTDAQATAIAKPGNGIVSVTGLGTTTVVLKRWDGRVLTLTSAAAISATSEVTGPEFSPSA